MNLELHKLLQIAFGLVGDDLRLGRLSCGKALPSRRAGVLRTGALALAGKPEVFRKSRR
jgi:hypothetical protein